MIDPAGERRATKFKASLKLRTTILVNNDTTWVDKVRIQVDNLWSDWKACPVDQGFQCFGKFQRLSNNARDKFFLQLGRNPSGRQLPNSLGKVQRTRCIKSWDHGSTFAYFCQCSLLRIPKVSFRPMSATNNCGRRILFIINNLHPKAQAFCLDMTLKVRWNLI